MTNSMTTKTMALLTIFAMTLTMVSMQPFVDKTQTASAQTAISDVSLIRNGNLIRAIGTEDVYVTKIVGAKRFKRLIINEQVFNSYDYSWATDVKDVTPTVMRYFTTSYLISDPAGKVYRLEPTQRDSGVKRPLELTRQQFDAAGFDWDAIYPVNSVEASEGVYRTGTPLTFRDFQSPVSSDSSSTTSTPTTTPVTVDVSGTSGSTSSTSVRTPSVARVTKLSLEALKKCESNTNIVKASWNRVSGATSYEIQYKRSSHSQWRSAGRTSAISVKMEGFLSETRYDLRVRAIKGSERGLFSAVKRVTTFANDEIATEDCEDRESEEEDELGRVTNLRVIDDSETSLTLRWSSVDDADDYQIQYKRDDSNNWIRHSQTPSSTRLVLTGLATGTEYDIRVRARKTGPTEYGDWSRVLTESTQGSTRTQSKDISFTRIALDSDLNLEEETTKTVLSGTIETQNTSFTATQLKISLQPLGDSFKRSNPAETFDRMQLIVDGDVVETESLSASDFTRSGNVYTLTFADRSLFSIADDRSENLEIRLRTRDNLNASYHRQNWKVFIAPSGLVGEDDEGDNQYLGNIEQTFSVLGSSTTTTGTGTSTDGSLSVRKLSTPAWGVELSEGDEETVLSLEMTANNADIVLDRVLIEIKSQDQRAQVRQGIDRLQMYVDDRRVATRSIYGQRSSRIEHLVLIGQNAVTIEEGDTVQVDFVITADDNIETDAVFGLWSIGIYNGYCTSHIVTANCRKDGGIHYKVGTSATKQYVLLTDTNVFEITGTASDSTGSIAQRSGITARKSYYSTPTLRESRNADVLRMTVQADNDDMTVYRVDVDLTSRGGSGKEREPWDSFDRIELRHGSRVVKNDSSLSSTDFRSSGNTYTYRFENLDIDIDEDESAEFRVRLYTDDRLTSADEQGWRIEIPERGIRARDTNSQTRYAGGNISNTFTVDSGSSSDDDNSDDGDSGSLSMSRSSSPSGVELEEGETDEVIAFRLDADDSDIEVDRIKIRLESQDNDKEQEPWDTFERMRLIVDDDVVATESLSSSDFTEDGDGYIITFNLSSEIDIDEDERVEVAVELRTDSSLSSSDFQEWEIEIDEVRGTDESDDTVRASGSARRTFEVVEEEEDTPSSSRSSSTVPEVEISLDSSTPDRGSVRVDANGSKDDIELLVFNVDGDNEQDLRIDDVVISFNLSADALGDIVDTVYLYEGNSRIGRVRLNSGDNDDIVFQNLNLALDEDDTVELRVVVDVYNITDREALYASVRTIRFDEYATVDGRVRGNTITLVPSTEAQSQAQQPTPEPEPTPEPVVQQPVVQQQDGSVTVQLHSFPIRLTGSNQADATFDFTVNAVGTDVYLSRTCGEQNGSNDSSKGIIVSVPALNPTASGHTAGSISCRIMGGGDSQIHIPSGSSRRIRMLVVNVYNNNQAKSNVYAQIDKLQWRATTTGTLKTTSFTGLRTGGTISFPGS